MRIRWWVDMLSFYANPDYETLVEPLPRCEIRGNGGLKRVGLE